MQRQQGRGWDEGDEEARGERLGDAGAVEHPTAVVQEQLGEMPQAPVFLQGVAVRRDPVEPAPNGLGFSSHSSDYAGFYMTILCRTATWEINNLKQVPKALSQTVGATGIMPAAFYLT
jgi:hypothetical protein